MQVQYARQNSQVLDDRSEVAVEYRFATVPLSGLPPNPCTAGSARQQ